MTVRKLLDVDVNEKPTKMVNGLRKDVNDEDDDDDVYFNSYSHWNIHESMLKVGSRKCTSSDYVTTSNLSVIFIGLFY